MTRSGTAPSPPPAPRLRGRFFLYGGAIGLAVLAVLEAGLHIANHDDLWWGLATGRHITESLEIPQTDIFSHTFAGRPWVNLEWLSHVLFYNLYHHLGENWIVYLRLGLVFLIFAVALALCVMRSRSWLVALLTVAFGAWVCQPFLAVRPQLFTFLYSAVVLLILHLFRRRGRNLLFLIPLVLVVWTQQHGGYIFGLLLLIGNLVAECGKRLLHLPADPLSLKQLRTLAAVTALSAAAVVFNPWTFEAYTHPFAMSKLVAGDNVFLTVTSEWLPPRFFTPEPLSPLQFWPFLLLVGSLTLPVALVRWRCFDFNDVGLSAVLAVFFAFQHRRFIPLFTILSLPLLSWAVRFWVDWWLQGREERARRRPGSPPRRAAKMRLRRLAAVVAAGAWLLLLSVLPFRLLDLYRSYALTLQAEPAGSTLFGANSHLAYYPQPAVRFLRQARVPGRMYNLYNWGGYLQFFFREHKTFIDGRAQTAFDERLQHQYLTVRWGDLGWQGILERYGVTYALIHRKTNAVLLRAMDRDPRWQWVFAHGDSAVFLRQCPENREILSRFRSRDLPLPETGWTYFLYGRQAGEDGDFEQAASDFAKACELSPGNDEFRSRWLLALSSAGRSEEARRAARRAAAELPDSAPIALARARLEAEAGRGDVAFRIFEEVFRRRPDRVEAVDGMFGIDLEKGKNAVEQAYRSDPVRPWMSYAMARSAELQGDFEQARRFYDDEGRDADRAGDQARLLWSRQAFDRARSRIRPPPPGSEETSVE